MAFCDSAGTRSSGIGASGSPRFDDLSHERRRFRRRPHGRQVFFCGFQADCERGRADRQAVAVVQALGPVDFLVADPGVLAAQRSTRYAAAPRRTIAQWARRHQLVFDLDAARRRPAEEDQLRAEHPGGSDFRLGSSVTPTRFAWFVSASRSSSHGSGVRTSPLIRIRIRVIRRPAISNDCARPEPADHQALAVNARAGPGERSTTYTPRGSR